MGDIEPETSPRTLSRRGFLKTLPRWFLVATGIDSLSGSLGGPSITKKALDTFPSKAEMVDPLKNKIEQQFNIDVIGPQDQATIRIRIGGQQDLVMERSLFTAEWNGIALIRLSRSLKNLPSHFYSPDHGEKLRFALVIPKGTEGIPGYKLGDSVYKGWCVCSEGIDDPQVIALEKDFVGNFMLESSGPRDHITHELIHRVFNTLADARRVLSDVGISSLDLEQVNRELEHFDTSVPLRMQDKVRFVSRLLYGVQNFNEFVSVAGEIYLSGRDNFVERYREYFGEEKANNLYEFMKDEIFRGKEY